MSCKYCSVFLGNIYYPCHQYGFCICCAELMADDSARSGNFPETEIVAAKASLSTGNED